MEQDFEVVEYRVGRANSRKFGTSLFISKGGDKWMRLPSKRDHFWQHAKVLTNGVCDELEPGDWVSFRTYCTACARECYEESPLEFLPSSMFYSTGSMT